MEWISVTGSTVLDHLPTDVAAKYVLWIADFPDRAARLSDLAANAVTELRDNIKTNLANVLDPDTTKIPIAAVRHIETIITFQLAMEMGLAVDTAGTQAMTRAEMFLRQCAYDRFTVTSDAEGAGAPSPSYTIPSQSAGRALPAIFLALLMLAAPALAGWIKPDSTTSDLNVYPTFSPTAYTNSTSTLFGHLWGINGSLGALQSLTRNITTNLESFYPSSNPSNYFPLDGRDLNGRSIISNGFAVIDNSTGDGGGDGALLYLGNRFNQNPVSGENMYGIQWGTKNALAAASETEGLYRIRPWPDMAQFLIWDASNDGAGSGLDADTLDGYDSATFLAGSVSNWSTYPPRGTVSFDSEKITDLDSIRFTSVAGKGTGSYTLKQSGGTLVFYDAHGAPQDVWHEGTLTPSLYQTVAGFNGWATNRLQWVGASPTTRNDAGVMGQVRGEGTNLFIRTASVWARILIDTNALPE